MQGVRARRARLPAVPCAASSSRRWRRSAPRTYGVSLAQEATRRPAPSSHASTVAALRSFFRLCVESEHLQRDPAHVLRTPQDARGAARRARPRRPRTSAGRARPRRRLAARARRRDRNRLLATSMSCRNVLEAGQSFRPLQGGHHDHGPSRRAASTSADGKPALRPRAAHSEC